MFAVKDRQYAMVAVRETAAERLKERFHVKLPSQLAGMARFCLDSELSSRTARVPRRESNHDLQARKQFPCYPQYLTVIFVARKLGVGWKSVRVCGSDADRHGQEVAIQSSSVRVAAKSFLPLFYEDSRLLE